MTKALALVMFAGCVPQRYYVTDIQYDSRGNLVADRCEFDNRGRPTDNCESEQLAPPAPSTEPDTPAEKAAAHAANAPVATRPAPTSKQIGKALASPGVYHAVELCRARFAPSLSQFSFTFALAPSGKIAITPHDGTATFADCASRALAGANLLAYDGAPVQFEQTLVFDGSPGGGG